MKHVQTYPNLGLEGILDFLVPPVAAQHSARREPGAHVRLAHSVRGVLEVGVGPRLLRARGVPRGNDPLVGNDAHQARRRHVRPEGPGLALAPALVEVRPALVPGELALHHAVVEGHVALPVEVAVLEALGQLRVPVPGAAGLEQGRRRDVGLGRVAAEGAARVARVDRVGPQRVAGADEPEVGPARRPGVLGAGDHQEGDARPYHHGQDAAGDDQQHHRRSPP